MKRVDLAFAAASVPLDYLAFLTAALAAYGLRYANAFATLRPVTFTLTLSDYLRIAVPIGIVLVLVFAVAGLYTIRSRRLAIEASRIFLATSAGFALVLAIAFFSRTLFESRFIMLAAWGLAILFVGLERLVLRLVQRALRSLGAGVTNVAIIGKTKSGNALVEYFKEAPYHGFHVALQAATFDEARERLRVLKRHGEMDMIIVADADLTRKEVNRIKNFADVEHLTFAYSAEFVPSGVAARPIIHTFAGQPVIEIPATPLDGWGAIYKRGFDLVVSGMLILLTSPLQLLIALAILVESGWPIFYSQPRVGQAGRPFPFLKFRSMQKNAHALRFDEEFMKTYGNERKGSPLFKLKNDPRITRVGRFLRAWSLDEIPQFYLVLTGSMSLVGPRPHLPEEVARYHDEARKVLTIKPGITGMAQTSGRASLDFDDEVRLDMYYIANWSPWLDLVILLKTPFAVLFRTGAY